MPPFGFQKATFYTLKGRLSHCERRPFVTLLIIRQLRGGQSSMSCLRGRSAELPPTDTVNVPGSTTNCCCITS